ncbi:MAG: adenylate/guanylate cyclase domain-containing protein, partial [Myxococcales bacterium]|nr:adenylate/guanylate cyclase domain-containing protein [Myxococcales bacterium]
RTGALSGHLSLGPVAARIERLSRAHFPDQRDPLRLVHAGQVLLGGAPGPVEPPVAQAAKATTAGVAPSVEYPVGGEPVTAAVVAVPGWPFTVVVRQPQAVVYGRLQTMRRIVIGTIAAAILAAVLLALVMARRITRPVRDLAHFATELAARRFGGEVQVQTRDELAMLGQVMSAASRRLKESEQQLLNEAAIRTDLGRYLPREIVERVVAREQDMRLGGQRTDITVLFADVVGFTPLAESQPAEVVVTVLNELFTLLTDIVFRHGGTIDKFIGDCVMAVWGAPNPQGDHAERALLAAEDMMRWVEAAGAGWQARFGVDLQLAIGINSGEAVVGNVGSESRMEYTAIGDAVNVAARLEGIARPNQILITRATRDAAGDGFEYAPVGRRPVTGRAEPVQLFEVSY